MAKRKRGRKASSSSSSTKKSSSPTPSSTSPTPTPPPPLPSSSSSTDLTNHHDSTSNLNQTKKEPAQLILTSVKRNGLYECDYCHTDISQVPRICCAICTDFDICLDCFTTTQLNSTSGGGSGKGKGSGADGDPKERNCNQHDAMSHGYKVADSTKYFLFPSLRGVESIHNENYNPMDGGSGQSQSKNDHDVKRIKLDTTQNDKQSSSDVCDNVNIQKNFQKNDETANDNEEKVTNSENDKVILDDTNDDNNNVMDIDVKDDDKKKDENETMESTCTSMDVDTSVNEEKETKENSISSSAVVDIQGKLLFLRT
jgi:hypothetical protein